jgi:hypothetical protein
VTPIAFRSLAKRSANAAHVSEPFNFVRVLLALRCKLVVEQRAFRFDTFKKRSVLLELSGMRAVYLFNAKVMLITSRGLSEFDSVFCSFAACGNAPHKMQLLGLVEDSCVRLFRCSQKFRRFFLELDNFEAMDFSAPIDVSEVNASKVLDRLHVRIVFHTVPCAVSPFQTKSISKKLQLTHAFTPLPIHWRRVYRCLSKTNKIIIYIIALN